MLRQHLNQNNNPVDERVRAKTKILMAIIGRDSTLKKKEEEKGETADLSIGRLKIRLCCFACTRTIRENISPVYMGLFFSYQAGESQHQ